MALDIETKVDSSEKLAAIAGKPTEHYLFAGEINAIVDHVKELELLVEQNTLTSENFGSFSNSLLTEDDIQDSDKIIFTDTSDANKQKKTSWLNIKAKLTTVFNALYQAVLVSGTNIKTINGNSVLGSGNLVVGGGSDYLLYKKKWRNVRLNSINTWRSPVSTYDDFDNNIFSSYGSGTTPNSTFFQAAAIDFVPNGYLIDSVELEISFADGAKPSNLQVYIARSEASSQFSYNGVSNTQAIVNETATIDSGSISVKYMKPLTVASHSLPTLAKSFLQIAVREVTSTDIYYSLAFNIIFKKA